MTKHDIEKIDLVTQPKEPLSDRDPDSVMFYECQICGSRYTKFGSHTNSLMCIQRLKEQIRELKNERYDFHELRSEIESLRSDMKYVIDRVHGLTDRGGHYAA